MDNATTSSTICDHCDDVAVAFCKECKEHLCKTTIEAHKSGKKTKDHVLERLKPVEETDNCGSHTHLALNVFCETCLSLMCAECVLDGHLNHSVKRLDQATTQMKTQLKEALDKSRSSETELQNANQVIDAVINAVTMQSKEATTHIDEIFEELQQLLQARKVKITTNLNDITTRKLQILQQQKAALTEVVNRSVKQNAEAAGFLSRESNLELARAYKGILRELQKVVSDTKAADKVPKEEATVCCDVDATDLKDLIATMGSVKALDPIASCCTVTGKADIKLNKLATATITIKNNDQIVKAKLFANVAALITDSAGAVIRATVQDNGDGTHLVKFLPTQLGKHKMYATLNGDHIKGSPFEMMCLPPKITNITIVGDSGHSNDSTLPQNTLNKTEWYWACKSGGKVTREEWISYDLQAPHTVSKLKIKHKGSNQAPAKLKLQTSSNGSSWQDVLSFETQKITNMQTFTGFTATSRLWRLVMLENFGTVEFNQCCFVLDTVEFFGFPVKP